MTKTIDPYGSELVADYVKVIKDFGLEPFDIKNYPSPNKLMRRGVVFAERDIKPVLAAMKGKKPFYVLSGIMPTAKKVHLGTKMVVENIKYFQEHGAKTFCLVADLEAAAARGISLKEARENALEFQIPAYLALGLDPKNTTFYFQSENKEVMHLAYEFSKKITLNEYKAIFGVADPGRIMSALTQAADILYPQLKERMPGVIPVGVDQDPAIRLTRDIVRRTKEKKFFLPSGLYHKFTPSLDGALKMSKSKPESSIDLPDDPKKAVKKVMCAKTGGRKTVEEQRKMGGVPEDCIIFELYKQHLMEDDNDLKKIYDDCRGGRLLCGEDKQICAGLISRFMENLEKDIDKARKDIDMSEIASGARF
ncbi:MAG TPA: tryptophan--tRNA ligase [Candidatus Nanoarchaeia archaeon]|nr:tryptophan--tRNA ligase [Candidatus Nanoarchaeia archaeon]